MDNLQLNEEGKDLWNQKAAFWDQLHGDKGNRFHQELVNPIMFDLMDLQPGETVLDIACGSGQMARQLAEAGAQVTAVDFSDQLINLAKKRGTPQGFPINYQVVDATDEKALLALGPSSFDIVISTMAFMDIPVLDPLFRAASQLLKPDGRLVFATAHPAFFTNNTGFISEMNEIDGKTIYTHSLKTTYYLELPPQKGVGAPNEPAPHYYFHRTMEEIFQTAFQSGFVLDALREPGFREVENPRPLSWQTLTQIPPVLAGRLRLWINHETN